MKKAPELDLSSTRTVTVPVEGVKITVRVDANGWPLTARCNGWPVGWPITARSTDVERLHRLAIAHVCAQVERTAEASAEARRDAERTKKSTEKKRKNAAEHFSREWFAAALRQDPNLGAERLMLAARRLVLEKTIDRDGRSEPHPDYAKRDEISEHRAKQYLRTIKKSGET